MWSLLHPFGYSLPSAPRGRPSTSRHARASRSFSPLLSADVVSPPLPSAPSPTATFNNTWYAVGLSEQIAGDRLLGTRLWGEPMVVYRDAAGEATCVRDLCPHRSAPLSMGELEDGVLRCFYHGWAFGAKGECVDVPTVKDKKGGAFAQLACAQGYSVAERDGLLWVWRGETLAADAAKLPSPPAAEPTVAVDTVLDYEADWASVVEGLLDAPGATFEAPNVVRREGTFSSRLLGLSEELHVQPIAPGRARVLMRQRLPAGAPLAALLDAAPEGARRGLELLIRGWNWRYAAETTDVATGAPMSEGARTAPAAAAFATFGAAARAAEGGAEPAFARWEGAGANGQNGLGASLAPWGQQTDDFDGAGTYGLKKAYVQATPAPEYAPAMVTPYRTLLDDLDSKVRAAATAAVGVPAAVLAYRAVQLPAFANTATEAAAAGAGGADGDGLAGMLVAFADAVPHIMG